MKVTVKITSEAHRKLQIAKGIKGTKTLGDTIQLLAEECIELNMKKGK